MFRHKGKSRNKKHNLSIAILLSFVAGMVNVVGFLAVQKLTTNVTGHFAFMMEAFLNLDYLQVLFFLIYIFSFFAGSFFSNFIIEFTSHFSDKFKYIIPIFTEILLLGMIALLPLGIIKQYQNMVACTLLFSMGLQNSLVTIVSNSIVRTTHLTGLFTDLGIECSQLFFYKSHDQYEKLINSIQLRLSIIFSFFVGGILGGYLFPLYQNHILIIASILLVLGFSIDYLILQFKIHQKKKRRDNSILQH